MKYTELESIISSLSLGEQKTIYSNGHQTIYIARPQKLSARFKNYDPQKNFQIWLQTDNKHAFKPNHFRLLIDLYLRVSACPASKEKLLYVFDRIFYGDDPLELVNLLSQYHFSQVLNPLDISAVLSQLFLAEQNISYGKTSKYEPRALYLQGWIRTFINDDLNIDQAISGIHWNRTPSIKYTGQDDKNNPKYNPDAQPLWYI